MAVILQGCVKIRLGPGDCNVQHYSLPPVQGLIVMADDAVYQSHMSAILRHSPGRNAEGPAQLLDHLYIGNWTDADNVPKLRECGITHVLNLARYRDSSKSPYAPDSGITGYKQIDADDRVGYDIMQHFPAAIAFIEQAREDGGRVLVHCALGVNRSGAICAAYIMAYTRMDLLKTIKYLKERRNVILGNRGFQKRLICFARQEGLLVPPDTPLFAYH